jgi:hypothetical protein
MPKLLRFSERVGRRITIRLDSGEPCLISVAQTGVLVKIPRIVFLGATLYSEGTVYKAAKTGMALTQQFPTNKLPVQIENPLLRSVSECRMTLSSGGGGCPSSK